MRPAGPDSQTRSGPIRATVAVVALYAFVLQAFLGGLMPRPHSLDGLICAQAQASTPDAAAPDTPAPHDHDACCTLAQVAGASLPVRPEAVAAAWPARAGTRIAWTPSAAPRARAPPGLAAFARGPPFA